MTIKSLNPYLNFDGNAEEAIKFYERTLGARNDGIMRFGEGPPEMAVAPEYKNRVMHCQVNIGASAVLMVSDTMPGMPRTVGNNVWVALHFDEPASMDAKFDALAQGGNVTMPLADTFWGARFGMLVDKFGVGWMFNCELKR